MSELEGGGRGDVGDEPSRIILPGGHKPGTLVGLDGRPLSSGGHDEEGPGTADALPAFPRLRPLDIQEVREGDKVAVLLSDPSGIAPQPIAVSPETIPILSLFDGSVSLEDLVDLVNRETGDPRAGENVRRLVEVLDKQLLLESPRYFAERDRVQAEYRALPARPAALAGTSYPADPAELTGFLEQQEEVARAWKSGARPAPGLSAPATAAPSGGAPRALAAPHIDLRRGGSVIARAYLEFDGVPTETLPDVVFVFGVGHMLLEEPFAITAKPFATPLGTVDVEADAVHAIIEAAGPALLSEEMAHRDEHSIEFQAVALRRRFGERPLRIVPLLCGGFHELVRFEHRPAEEPKIEAVIAATRAAAAALVARGKTVAFVAGVDLSHVGARFGDEGELDEATLAEVEKHDRAALDAAVRGDAEGWFDAIAAHGDSTRICGFAAMYAMLRVAEPGPGRLLAYEQSLEPGGSVVTYGAIAWP
ncbi:MAG: AmmeMemoRadiSam system protein B [Candidatus Eisenbacteria bacterium]